MCDIQTVQRVKTVIKELIELYRDMPCLWNQKDKFYTSKQAREKAYKVLLDKYKLLEEDANFYTVKKKIDNLRSSFKREHRKVTKSKNRHKPTLWYYKLMLFLIEDSDGLDPSDEYMSFDFEEDEETATPLGVTLSPEQHDVMTLSIKEEYTPESKKRADTTSVFLTDDLLDDTASSHTVEEKLKANEAFGKTIGLQLYELSVKQKTIAEKLISEVIFYGRLGKLTAKTKMININDLDG